MDFISTEEVINNARMRFGVSAEKRAKEFSGLIYEYDFYANEPPLSGMNIDRVISAIKFNKKMKKYSHKK